MITFIFSVLLFLFDVTTSMNLIHPHPSPTSEVTLDSTVQANFRINSISGGQRGIIYLDGKEVVRRSNYPVSVGRREIHVKRGGYTLEFAEINGELVFAEDNRVIFDVTPDSETLRIVLSMSDNE